MWMRYLSAEFILDKRANGGTVVLMRSLWVTAIVYLLAVAAKEVTDPKSLWWTWCNASLLSLINETIPWAGAIFAGAYVALYSRFSSQWAYLAGLYNQIFQSEATSVPESEDAKKLSERKHALWWAGFIEDALELHLATKPMFATIIRHLLVDRPEVQSAFVDSVPGGEPRMKELLSAVEEVCRRTAENWRRPAESKGDAASQPNGLS
jgi:hypothetical protein